MKPALIKLAAALALALAAGCAKSSASPASDERTACLEPAPHDDCFEYPGSEKANFESHKKICLNYQGARFLDAACPRQDTAGGCRSKYADMAGMPTVYYYHLEKADILKKCEADGDHFVEP